MHSAAAPELRSISKTLSIDFRLLPEFMLPGKRQKSVQTAEEIDSHADIKFRASKIS